MESEERERGRRIARGIADSYTDADWEYALNALDPARAARKSLKAERQHRSSAKHYELDYEHIKTVLHHTAGQGYQGPIQ